MKKISFILTIAILALLLILCGCSSENDPADGTDTDVSEENADIKQLKEEILAVLTPNSDNAFILNDDIVYTSRSITPEMMLTIRTEAYHVLDYNDSSASPQALCNDNNCSHSDVRCKAYNGASYPIMVESDGVTVMYYFDWINGKPEIEGLEIPIFEDIEAMTGETVREAGFLFEYNFETGERRTVASYLPFGGQISCYYNGKIYISCFFSKVGGLYSDLISDEEFKKIKYFLLYCVDVKTGEFSLLKLGETPNVAGIYNDKLYAIGDSGKVYECELDLSGYSEYTSVSGSAFEIISMSDGVLYYITDGTLYMLNIAKGEKTAELIAENVHTVKSYEGDAYYAHADYRIVESGDVEMEVYTDGVIHKYDVETKETEVFLPDMGVDAYHIMYMDAERMLYSGSYYGGADAGYEYTGTGLVDCVYDFEKEELRIIIEY